MERVRRATRRKLGVRQEFQWATPLITARLPHKWQGAAEHVAKCAHDLVLVCF